jgi:C1A family cysteine protease
MYIKTSKGGINMKKIVSIVIIGFLLVSGAGVLVQARDSIDDCGCNDSQKIGSYGKLFPMPPLIDGSIISDLSAINNKFPLSVDASNDIFPDYFNWRDHEGKDWTTPAKEQGNCGSCWDFAAIGALESIIKIREECADMNPDLSEQYVLSCLPAAANNYGEGCWGGTPYGAFFYMMNTTSEGNYQNGAIPETCFPYHASDDISCSEKCENWEDLLVPILDCAEGYLGFDSPESRAIIKSQIYQYGPVAAGMNVTNDFINFGNVHHDPTDYFPDPDEPWGMSLNHIIVILGWKNDSSIDNGGYWICKNSWGTNWGYNGFYNIEYGALFTGFYVSAVDYDPDSFDWPPNTPAISGPASGKPEEEYEYTFTSMDPDGVDDVFYYIDWGDNSNSGWIGPFESDEIVIVKHTWENKGTYNIRAKTKDTSGLESDWGYLDVTMPVSQSVQYPFLELFREHFPLLKLILGVGLK